MQMANLYSLRNKFIYFSIMVLVMSIVLSSFPNNSAANVLLDEIDINQALNLEVIEVIKDTDAEVIYKTLEDGEIYLYEESIVGDVVTTKKSLVADEKSTLLEEFSTTTTVIGNTMSISQTDLLTNQPIYQASFEIMDHSTQPVEPIIMTQPNLENYSSDGEFSIMATGTWVKSRTAGQNYAYYKYSNGGGLARELGKQKTISSYTTRFDTFTRNVDSARSYERGILYNLTVIGVLDQAFKYVKQPTIANLKEFFKRYLKTIPGLSVIIATITYFNIVNRTIDSYKAIPGTAVNWR